MVNELVILGFIPSGSEFLILALLILLFCYLKLVKVCRL